MIFCMELFTYVNKTICFFEEQSIIKVDIIILFSSSLPGFFGYQTFY